MKKAGDILSSFFDQHTYTAAREYSELFNSWKAVAGDALSCHSRIRELDRSILLIEADHPGWIQILQTKQADLLERVRRRFPDLTITAISIRLAKDFPSPAPDGGRTAILQRQETTEAEEIPIPAQNGDPFDKIEDASFKDTLKRLEKSIAARNSRGNPGR